MQCAVIKDAFQPLELTSRPFPACPEYGLLLKTLYAGVCQSDLHYVDDRLDLGNGKVCRIRDNLGDDYKGIILGHEICGEIIEIGKSVPPSSPWKPGDCVLVYFLMGCQKCAMCVHHENQLCANNQAGGTDIGHGKCGGGYASHVVVPHWDYVVALPENIPPHVGCLLPCSGLTAYNALLKCKPSIELALKTRTRCDILIVGVGGLGMWAIILTKLVFKGTEVKVICADITQEKLDIANDLGADATILWKPESNVDSLIQRTTDLAADTGFAAAIDFVGSNRTLSAALGSLGRGGAVVAVGLSGGDITVSIPDLIFHSIQLYGSRVGSSDSLQELVTLVSQAEQPVWPFVELVTLEQINDVLDTMRQGLTKGRTVIKY